MGTVPGWDRKDRSRSNSRMKTTQEPTLGSELQVAALAQLGTILGLLGRSETWPGHSCGLNEAEYEELNHAIAVAHQQNNWFTETNVRNALGAWAVALSDTALRAWLNTYTDLVKPQKRQLTVGLVLAGNLPLVGWHDVLCVLLSGHKAKIKSSSQDHVLLPALITALDRLLPGSADLLEVTQGKLDKIDAVIATGSNNTSRYFEYYFKHIPRIVRKSRTSVAILDGTETPEELTGLGEDVFRYFGMGCRNVSKLYFPLDYDLDRVFNAIFPWKDIVNHNKYANNYDYQRALWMLDQVAILENGFVLLKEDTALASPMGAIYYERYQDLSKVEEQIAEQADQIQCVVGHGHVPFGQSQFPALNDYADGVDTMEFLLGLQ